MATEERFFIVCVLVLTLITVTQGSTCFVSNSHYEKCDNGCCGSSPYEECCENSVGLIVGLVVAGFVVVLVGLVLVCCYLQYKSNQVVRIVESAHSQRHGANITILHMSSDNPYQNAPKTAYTNAVLANRAAFPNQPSLDSEYSEASSGYTGYSEYTRGSTQLGLTNPGYPQSHPDGHPAYPPLPPAENDTAAAGGAAAQKPMNGMKRPGPATTTSTSATMLATVGSASPEPKSSGFSDSNNNGFVAPAPAGKGGQARTTAASLPPIKSSLPPIRSQPLPPQNISSDLGLEDLEDLD